MSASSTPARPPARAAAGAASTRRGYSTPGGLGRSSGEWVPRDALVTEMEVAHRGGDVLVTELALHRGEVGGAGFERVRGEGVAQGVDAALLADAGAQFRHRVNLLRHGDVDGAGALTIGEEPDAGRGGLPGDAEVVQQTLGERHVSILHSLALLHAHGHAVGVEIRDLQGDDLADAQARGVGRGEQEPVPRVRAGLEQAPDFRAAENLRQPLRLPRRRDVEVRLRVAERHMVEEAEGMRGLAARAPGQLAFLDQVGEIGLNLVVGELIR